MGYFKNTRITLINPQVEQLYSSMIPGLISKRFSFEESCIDLMKLTHNSECRFFKDKLISLEPEKKIIECEIRGQINYDILSISTGSETKTIPNLGNINFSYLKPFNLFISAFEAWVKTLEPDHLGIKLGIVGGGIAAIEVIIAIKKRVETELKLIGNSSKPEVFLLTKDKVPFITLSPQMRGHCLKVLNKKGIKIIPNFLAKELDKTGPVSYDGISFKLDFCVLATGPSAQSWIKNSGLTLCENGFISVKNDLTCEDFENIFVTGDIAFLPSHPNLSKSGVVAVRQGAILVKNIQKRLESKELTSFKPQRFWLSLVGLENNKAIASYGKFAVKSSFFWHLKNFIDLKFINKFKSFKKMNTFPSNSEKSIEIERCGGCGSKVGANILRKILNEFERDEKFPNIDEMDEDAGVTYSYANQLNLHTIDGFRQLIDEPYNMGLITSHHSISDITAMGGTPKTALAMVGIPINEEKLVKNDLRLALRGILTGLKSHSVNLIGGHTNESESISLALAITGTVQEDEIIKKNTIQPGDRIILTQPIGAGVIFAGLMAGLTKGRWVEEVMSEINREKVGLIKAIKETANACTDVTGFGLAGHLYEMTKNSEFGININLHKLQFFEGAEELSLKKVRSSLFSENANVEHQIDANIINDPRYDLCFDPQTAGGLLLSIPTEIVGHCLERLHILGCRQSREIGAVVNDQRGLTISL